LAGGVPGADRVRLELDLLPRGTSFAPPLGRVLLNLLVLAPEALPRGGTLALSRVDEAAVLARLSGPRAAWPNGFATYLGDPAAALAALVPPRFRLGPWLALLAAQLGVRLSLLLPAGRARGPAPLLLRAEAGG
ncbi:MAG: histidine phosphotransferase family protein, partial [Acetobacteraceae bacterium]